MGKDAPEVLTDDPPPTGEESVGKRANAPAGGGEERAGEASDEPAETFGDKLEGITHE